MNSVYTLLFNFALGILLFRYKEAFESWYGFFLGLCFLLVFRHLKGRRWQLFIWGVFAGAGFIVAAYSQLRGPQPVEIWAPRVCSSVEGIVTDLPSVKLTGKRARIRFVLEAERLLYASADCAGTEVPLPETLKIQKLSGGKVQVFLLNPPVVPEPGDRVRIFGALQRPRGPLNPGEMDYAAYLAANRIYAAFSGIGPASLQLLEPAVRLNWDARIQKMRKLLAERLDRVFGPGELHAELLKALLLGLRSQFPQDLWQIMMRTGTAHIISISGLHMSVLSAFVYALLLLTFRSQKKAALGAAAALILYMFVAGGSIPVQRAALMGAVTYAGLLLEREIQPMRLLAWVCWIQLIQEPLSLGGVSFQLSFLSVFILLLMRYLPGVHALIEPFRATVFVLAGTLPVTVWHFHMVSWMALIANLWAIPFFNFALVTGIGILALADVPVLGWLSAKLCAFCLDAGFAGLRPLSQCRFGWTSVAQPEVWKIVYYYGWAAGWFLSAGKLSGKVKPWLRHCLLAGWITAGGLFLISPQSSAWSITVLSGTRLPLVHIQEKSKHWLINVGQASGGYDTERKLLPYLKWKGIQRLSGIIFTDYSKDVDRSLSRLGEDAAVQYVYGPAPQTAQAPAFMSAPAEISWRRAGLSPELFFGSLKIKSLSRRGKIKMIQLMTEKGQVLFFLSQLDGESAAMIEQRRNQGVVLILYGAACGNQPAVRHFRKRLQRQMKHAVWVYAQEGGRVSGVSNPDAERPSFFSLKKLGALRIQEFPEETPVLDPSGRQIQLQFLSGSRVTIS